MTMQYFVRFFYATSLLLSLQFSFGTQTSTLGIIPLMGKQIAIDFPDGYPVTQKIQEDYPVLKAKIENQKNPEWKIKVFLLTRADILEKSRDGIYRPRRSSLEAPQIQKTLESLAQFKALAETATKGGIKITFDISEDHDPARWVIETSQQPINPLFIQQTFAPRINPSEFDADDKVYRGPYHSIFFIHPVLTHSGDTFLLHHTPLTSISYYTHPYAEHLSGLAFSLYDTWLRHLRLYTGKSNTQNAFSSLMHLLPSQTFVEDHEWTSLAQNILSSSPTPKLPSNQKEHPSPLFLDTPQQNIPKDRGFFTVSIHEDPHEGAIIEVSEIGAFRHGYAELLNQNKLHAKLFTPSSSLLSFWIKAPTKDPYALWFESSQPGQKEWVQIGKSLPIPSELNLEYQAPFESISIAQEDHWQQVTLDLSKTKIKPEQLIRISLTPHPLSKFYERQQFEKVLVNFKGWKWVGQAKQKDQTPPILDEDEQILIQLTKMSTPLSKEDQKLILNLIKNSKEILRLNAIALLTQIKLEDAVPILIEQSKSATPFIAELSARALAYQSTPEAWNALVDRLTKGPFDHNKSSALGQIKELKDPKHALTISTLMTLRSWRGRREAVYALGKIKTPETHLMLMTFLHDIDSAVRLAVTEHADQKMELVNRRFLWNAVNDPSEQVSATSYAKLIESPFKDYRLEAYKGVRESRLMIRLFILNAMAKHPLEEHREALRLAVVDECPEVRASALKAFAALPGKIEVEEIENTLYDPNPDVQNALAILIKAKNLPVQKHSKK